MQRSALVAAAHALMVLPLVSRAAESPQLIPFQGSLVNAQNEALPDGQYTITFALYREPVGGTPVWTERHRKVGVIHGAVNVFLGSINPFLKTNGVWESTPDPAPPAAPLAHNVDFGTTKYLGVTVDADGDPATPDKEMAPRQIVLTAFHAPTTERLQDYGWDVLFGNQDPATGTLKLSQIPAITPAEMDRLIPDGSIQAANLDPGVTVNALEALGQKGVPDSGIVTSIHAADPALLGQGYVKIGSAQIGEGWRREADPDGFTPGSRLNMASVWTGLEWILWGGMDASGNLSPGSGARYSRAEGVWTALPLANAPTARTFRSESSNAVWAGSEMLIWGGNADSGGNYTVLADGRRYNRATDQWLSVSTAGQPSARTGNVMIYLPASHEVFVWGGASKVWYSSPAPATYFGDGAIYSLETNLWRNVTNTNAPSARTGAAGVLIGDSIVVWGGREGGTLAWVNTGKVYHPGTDTWTDMSAANAPQGRFAMASVRAGTDMLVWGGSGAGITAFQNGGRYSLDNNSWTPISDSGAPSSRFGGVSTWTGSELLIWGGTDNLQYFSNGGRWLREIDSWGAMQAIPISFTGLYQAASTWTGSEMLIYGGSDGSTGTNSLVSYTPPRTLYLYQKIPN